MNIREWSHTEISIGGWGTSGKHCLHFTGSKQIWVKRHAIELLHQIEVEAWNRTWCYGWGDRFSLLDDMPPLDFNAHSVQIHFAFFWIWRLQEMQIGRLSFDEARDVFGDLDLIWRIWFWRFWRAWCWEIWRWQCFEIARSLFDA